MKNYKEVSERFYFSYSKTESDYLKHKGFIYITKAIHPRSKVCFVMFDRSPKLLQAIEEYRLMKQ